MWHNWNDNKQLQDSKAIGKIRKVIIDAKVGLQALWWSY